MARSGMGHEDSDAAAAAADEDAMATSGRIALGIVWTVIVLVFLVGFWFLVLPTLKYNSILKAKKPSKFNLTHLGEKSVSGGRPGPRRRSRGCWP